VAALRVLVLEDSEADADLMLRELGRAGFEIVSVRVDGANDFNAALETELDLILADFRLPQYDALQALAAVRRHEVRAPVIVVSGAIGEDAGADCIKAGAADYVLKDRLGRLGVAVHQSLERRRLQQERVELEVELQQARRLEELGLLAGRIAHDFNNIIAVIDAYARLIAEPDTEQPISHHVAQITHATDRAAALTRQLLDFSRRETVRPVVVDLEQAMRDTRGLLAPALGDRIELVIRSDPGLWSVTLEDGQLEQILVNLAVNAHDAMPDGGTLIIEAGNLDGSDRGSADGSTGRFDPRRVRLSVRDTGLGMDPEVAARAFDPFFSTKSAGAGTGLGLATVYAIVTRAQGQARLLSHPGAGTTVEIELPAARRNADGSVAAAIVEGSLR
jgi:two-component system, cell cycle sensor histidine kinase and response regulator CckA